MSLPARGPWVVTPTSSSVDWVVAAAALAATTDGSAAAVVLGGFGTAPASPDPAPASPGAALAAPDPALASPDPALASPDPAPASPGAALAAHVAALVELPADTGLAAVAAVVTDLGGKHDRVVVLVGHGIGTPTGGGWTVADLATDLRAPVAVVTGTDADAAGHAVLALEALDRRQVPASVIVVGDGGDFDALPVRLAGRIPAGHAAFAGTFSAEAARWVDPLDGSRPVTTPVRHRDLQTRVAIRAAWTLAVAFLVALLLLCSCGGLRYPGTYS